MLGHAKAMAYAVDRISLSLAFVALNVALFAGGAAAQDRGKLEAQDYLDIRQLIDRYSHILDNCVNNGYRYADMFTADGTSACPPSGARVRKSGSRTRAACRRRRRHGPLPTPSDKPSYHLTINPVITPTADGAQAISTLLTITNDTDQRGDVVHWEGGYEDTFVKTADGWRFKSRLHVWPEIEWTDKPADMPPRNLADE